MNQFPVTITGPSIDLKAAFCYILKLKALRNVWVNTFIVSIKNDDAFNK